MKHRSVKLETRYHTLYWLLYYLLISLVEAGPQQYYFDAFSSNLISLPFKFAFVWITIGPLMNRYLMTKKTVVFLLFYLPLLVAFAIVLRLLDNYVILEFILTHWTKEPVFSTPPLLYNIIKLQFVAAVPVTIKLINHWIESERRNSDLQRQHTEAELAFLRGQIHPHFLFNALNSLYSKIITNSSVAAEMVLKISALLRMSLYEHSQMAIPVTKELEYLSNYIDLQRIRFQESIDISYSVYGEPVGKIEPFLILPLVENSFKYCQPNRDGQAWVTIQIGIDESSVTVKIDNSIQQEKFTEVTEGGLGQHNVKRRLALLFQERHTFRYEHDEENYYVYLKFPKTQ